MVWNRWLLVRGLAVLPAGVVEQRAALCQPRVSQQPAPVSSVLLAAQKMRVLTISGDPIRWTTAAVTTEASGPEGTRIG